MNVARRLRGIVAVGLFLLTIVSTATAKYSGGTGEPNDPYQIATAADLIALGETPNDYGKHSILTADIDLDPARPGCKTFSKAVIAPYTGSMWIIFSGRAFTGIFDGNGHVISHLTIAGEDYAALFGKLGSGGKIKNLGVVGVKIAGSHKVGGMVGENSGGIIRCYSTGVVTGSSDVGGLLGYAMGGDVTCSFSTAGVSGTEDAGGLVGTQWGTVSNCYSTGAVSCTWSSVGGLTGGNWGIITNCYSTGKVSGAESVGGLSGAPTWRNVTDSFWDRQTSRQTTSAGGTGKTTAEMKMAATYTNWDFEGTWTIQEGIDYPRLQWEVYGLPAMVPTTIERISGDGKCSPAGSKLAIPLSVRVKNQDDEPMFDVPVDFTVTAGGGMVEPASTATDSAGIASAVLTLGPTPGLNQVEAAADGLSVSFNITGLAPGYGGGTGEPNDPYQIWTAEQMNVIGAEPNDWGKHFELMADIDLSGFDGKDGRCLFNVIGTSYDNAFTGVFEGNGHIISHLTIAGERNLGLFGYLGSRAEVSDVGIADVNIVGYGWCLGGLVGENNGTVARCYCTGVVRGGYDIGGLVGENDGDVSHCYSTASVSGSYAGGLVGRNYGDVMYCYSTGAISGSSVGGLVGDRFGWFTEMHNVWDIETSGQSASAGGVGLTTAEMMAPYMLGLNGFANDPNWVLDAGRDYPRLAWEGTAGQMIPEPNVDWLEGDGTADAPYRVDTADQLIMLSRASAIWDRHFILGTDIDLDPNLPNMLVFTQPPIQLFTGVFDGNDHTIAHLTIKGNDYLGLFGQLAYGAEIKNLGIVNVKIAGSDGGHIGGLAGENRNGVVTGCYTTGVVSGDFYVGGVVGYNGGPVTHSYSTATVSGTNWGVGGLFGYSGGRVQQSYGMGAVKCGNVGFNIGGLVGENGGMLIQCFNHGPVSGASDVGGLVGDNRYGSVTDCYSSGAVKGGSKVGGLIGENWGTVSTCYSSGTVSGSSSSTGGLVGNTGIDPWAFAPTVTNSYWDTQTSGRTTSAGGIGKTTPEMQDMQTYSDAGWDFAGEMNNGTHEVWQMPEEGGYPVLAILSGYNPPTLQGQGTAQDPYLIYDALELGAVIHYSASAHYRLAASIDLSGICWGTAVIPSFSGTFDGNKLTISHLSITGKNNLGFFGGLASGSEIKDLRIVNVNITGSGGNVGALAGFNGGTVMRCHSTGTVSSDNSAGGLVGYNYGTVIQCWSSVEVSGTVGVGGLVGYNYGALTHCYSNGVVDGNDRIGGLLGYNGSTVTMCYSTALVDGISSIGGLVGNADTDPWAPVPTVTNSFWNTQTSSQATSAGGTGKTTAEMQTASTFWEAGWDFIGETANGTEDIWWINEGKDYPRLWWERAQ